MNIDVLYRNLGTYDNGLECLHSVHLLYPDLPKYRHKQDKQYILPLINKHFEEVDFSEEGNLLLFKFFNGFHFGIYAGENKFFHCCKNHNLRISRLSGYIKFLKGQYRKK